jgi:hypothetical protein
MNSPSVTLTGIVTPEGILQLNGKVPLPEGQVQVTIEPVVGPDPNDPFWQRMEAIWAAQKARGHVPRTKNEIDAEHQAIRDEAEEEMLEIEKIFDDAAKARRNNNDQVQPQ